MVQLIDTSFRDGQQSFLASRMKTSDILGITHKMDQVGFYALEVWSGSIFESCIRYLDEDPWERLKSLKESIQNTPLKCMTRGQNIFGMKPFADDVVEAFTFHAIQNGCDIIHVEDCLNNLRNLEVPVRAAKKYGARVEACILYDISPFSTIDFYVRKAKELEKMGSDIVSIHDSSGIMPPFYAYDLITALKQNVNIPFVLHSHCVTGMATMSYVEACRAGVDLLETVISPLSGGISLPSTESIVAAFNNTTYDTGYDLQLLNCCKKYFLKLRDEFSHPIDQRLRDINLDAVLHQLPSGMISFLIRQLERINALDRMDEVLREASRVRRDFGYPTLATPSSQIIAAQSAYNVILGERYKMVPREVREFVRGLYGKPPGDISNEIKEKILGENWKDLMVTRRPGDLMPDQFNEIKDEAEDLGLISKPEDALTYAMFPELAKKFLKKQ